MEFTVQPEARPNPDGGTGVVTVHVVSHTHWDREWYLSAVRFRQLLIPLVDELVDDPPVNGASFLLDGQMVAIEDYLEVRPERRDALAALLQSGAIEAGPWYVLADELIPTGESLVRNLLAGKRWLERFGAAPPPVLYCPDSFGHPAAMPALAAGFGFALAIASRGFGGSRWPQADAVQWQAPSGDAVTLYHLSKKGYDIGENLPADPASARERWASFRDDLLSRSRLGVALLPNGADHHARQRDFPAALAALADAARPNAVIGSSLRAFAADAVARAAATRLDTVRGELRDSYGYLWTLQGTFGTRAHQKRRNAQAERLLLRDAEPWAALARRRGGVDRTPLVNAAWKSLLLCHPHDTLCGCSTDEVARAMDARLDEAHSQGAGIRNDALMDLVGHDADAAREQRDAWTPVAVVRNPTARPRSGVAIVRLASFVSDVKVGANASPGPVATAAPQVPALGGVPAQQLLEKWIGHERTEAPRHYPDDDLVQFADVAVWVPEIAGYGVRCLPHQTRGRRGDVPNPVVADRTRLANGLVTLGVGDDGRVSLAYDGRVIPDLIRWESRTDRGDLYTPSIREGRFTPVFKGAKLVHRGPLRGTIETRWVFGGARDGLTATVRFSLDANCAFVRIAVSGENRASDHRLRIGIASDVANGGVLADAMFGPVERSSVSVSPAEAAFELPLVTAPLHRYVSTFAANRGATVFSDGLGEYESTADGTTWVTLVRSVDELSRGDLPERPGNAGWPTHTPEAQCTGPFAGSLALLMHDADSPATRDLVERTTDDVLLPITGASLRSALAIPDALDGVELEGTGLSCRTIKQSEDGASLVLRCVNVTDEPQDGVWTLGGAVSDARLARLDETPLSTLAVSGRRIRFTAPRRGVVTILVR